MDSVINLLSNSELIAPCESVSLVVSPILGYLAWRFEIVLLEKEHVNERLIRSVPLKQITHLKPIRRRFSSKT